MLFDLLRRGWYFDKDGGAGGAPGDGTEDDPAKDPSDAGDDKDKGKAGKDEKTFTQAELDQIVKDRLERERKKHEADAEKARKQAEAAALEKNQEWQKLAETRAQELADLAREKDELAPYKEQAEKYRAALDAQLAKAKEKLPKHILPLIEKLDPVEAMAYITEHAEELGAKLSTFSETPDPRQKKVSDDDKKEAQRASSTVISQSF